MGLLGDIQEVVPLWKRAPWRVKIILGFCLFLAVSSIASLADDVANWKGFFLTGVLSYQNYLRDPAFSWISNVTPLNFSAKAADTLTITLIISLAAIRSSVFRFKQRRKLSFATLNASLVLVVATSLVFAVIYLGHEGHTAASEDYLYRSAIINYAFLLYIAFFTAKSDASNLLLFVYLVVPPVIVCLAAAVNLGLRS